MTKISLNSVFPYITNKEYPRDKELACSLGNELFLQLVLSKKGLLESITLIELESFGVSVDTAFEAAFHNLDKILKEGKIPMTLYSNGPQNTPFIIFHDHWLAASCMTLPKLYSWSQNQLKSDEILACVPNQETLILFPNLGSEKTKAMKYMIEKKEGKHSKPLSLNLFSIQKDKIIEYSH